MYHLRTWQYQTFHISYMLAWLSAGVLTGLLMAKISSMPHVDGLIVVGGLLMLAGAFRSRRWWSVAIVTLVGIIIGISRGNLFETEIQMYQKFAHAQVLVSGTIDDDPTYGKNGDQQFRISGVTVNSRPMRGEVFVGTHSILDVKRGDFVELRGRLSEGFGSYQATLRYALLQSAVAADDPVREARDRFAAGVRNIVPEPSASLGIGFVVGQRSALPEELDDQLRIVGLTHIVVASGYNLTILVRFMRRILAKHSKYLAAVSSSGLMVAFVAVSGLSPSMTRAAAVTGLSLLAWYYGRRFHPLMLILNVAAATAWWYPVYIWSDLGWYLSFLAFAGVLILAPMAVRFFYQDPTAAPALVQLMIETTAAQIMTLPLILLIFGELPVLSLVSNILVAPVIPLAMVATALAGVVGLVAPSLLGVFGMAAGVIVGYVVMVVELLSGFSWAQLRVKISALAMAAMYGAVFCAAIALWVKTKHNFRATSVVD